MAIHEVKAKENICNVKDRYFSYSNKKRPLEINLEV